MFACCFSQPPSTIPPADIEVQSDTKESARDSKRQAVPPLLPGIAEEGTRPEAEKPCEDIFMRWRLQGPKEWGPVTKVHVAVNVATFEEVAVRTEDKESEVGGLAREAFLLKKVAKGGGKTGFAAFHHFGMEDRRHVLVTELLGPSLAALYEKCGRNFDNKTIRMIGVQMLYRLEAVHEMGILHRNISPESIRIGKGQDAETLYLTDFTQAKVFRNSLHHIPYRESTPRRVSSNSFSSTNTHLGAERSRRDDLESLSLVLAYFARGNLPWQDVEASEFADGDGAETWDQRLLDAKRSVAPKELTCDLPELQEMLVYCRSLWFEADPDYRQLRRLFRKHLGASSEGCGMFCWSNSDSQNDGTFDLFISECDDKSGGSQTDSTAAPSASGLSRQWSLRSSREAFTADGLSGPRNSGA